MHITRANQLRVAPPEGVVFRPPTNRIAEGDWYHMDRAKRDYGCVVNAFPKPVPPVTNYLELAKKLGL